MDHPHTPASVPSFWKSPFGIVCTIIAVAASIYLWIAHKNHLLALVPYAFLAACPLMHIFMHGGHHGHHRGGARKPDEPGPRDG